MKEKHSINNQIYWKNIESTKDIQNRCRNKKENPTASVVHGASESESALIFLECFGHNSVFGIFFII